MLSVAGSIGGVGSGWGGLGGGGFGGGGGGGGGVVGGVWGGSTFPQQSGGRSSVSAIRYRGGKGKY